MRTKRFGAWALATLMGVASLCSLTTAAPLDDRVPGNALFYFGWAGADALTPQYEKSNLKGIIDASAAKKFINDTLPKLVALAGREDPNAPMIIAKVQTGLDIAWRHPAAFYFCPIDWSNPKTPGFRVGIVCDAGADAKTLTDLFADVLKNAPPPEQGSGNTFKVVEENGTVLLSIGVPQTLAELKAGGGLAANPDYVKAMGQVKLNGAPAGATYVDMAKVLAMVEDALNKIPDVPADARTKITAVIDTLGVRGLTQMSVASGFDGKGWTDKAFMGIKGPRTGLLSLVNPTPVSAPDAVPKDAVAFSVNKFDLAKLYNLAKEVVDKVDERALRQMEDGVRQINQMVGFDIESDLIATLGDEWVVYRAPMGDTGMGMAMVTKLRNPDKFAATLATIEKMYNERSGLPIKVEKLKAGKTEVSGVLILTFNVCWVVHNGNLYISTLDAMPSAISQVDDKLPSITENPQFQAAMKAFPAGVKPTSISYSNPAKLYPELRTLAMGLIPLARGQGIDIPMDLLPDISAVREFMTPGGTISWSDADGIHVMGTSAFPGAAILSGQQGAPAIVAVAAVGAAVAMPALGRARVQAVTVADASNLRSLSQGCLIYAADHNGMMPDHIGQTLLDGMISPRALVNSRSGTAPLEMTPELEALAKSDFAKFAAQVDAHCDYVYLGKGVKETAVKQSWGFATIYEKPEVADRAGAQGINIAFLDGHVEFFRWGNVAGQFQQTINYLAEQKLPPMDVASLNQRDIMRSTGGAAAAPARPNQLP